MLVLPIMLALLAPLPPPSAPLQVTGADPDRVAAWRADLDGVYERLRELHPDPFFGTPRADFDAARDALAARIGKLTDDEVIVELMRFVALVSREGRDGHSGIFPSAWTFAPIVPYRFSDGWFVVKSRDGERVPVGARIAAVGSTPIDDIEVLVDPLLTKDNDTQLLEKRAALLLMPELHHALGLTGSRERTAYRLVLPGGERRDVELAGIDAGEFFAWADPRVPGPPPQGDALWLSNKRAQWWSRALPDDGALYAQVNAVRSADDAGGTIGAFAAGLVRELEQRELDRLVLDLRINGGGDNTTFGPLVDALKGCGRLRAPGSLYVLVGRHTFSAAGNLVTVLQRDAGAALVGEPTGGAPNQYGDAEQVALEHHPELLLFVSTRYHAFGGGDDKRTTHAPDVAVSTSSSDYFDGRDPVLRAALVHSTPR